MGFRDFNLETDDKLNSSPEHFNGTVTTAGSPVTLSLTSTNDITYAFILNPSKGPNANSTNDVLLVNIDGTATYTTLARGESISLPVNNASIKIDTTTNGTKYEVILWG